jgi:[acyl-carrier-protein] S-malonyltransferase
LMKPAQDRLKADLNAIKMQEPVYPVACNVDAELVTDHARAHETLLQQVTGSVKWEQCMRLLIAQGVQTFIEVGPGKVLCGLMRQIDRSKACMNVSDDASLAKTLESLPKMPV